MGSPSLTGEPGAQSWWHEGLLHCGHAAGNGSEECNQSHLKQSEQARDRFTLARHDCKAT